jgi:hypothetical protein
MDGSLGSLQKRDSLGPAPWIEAEGAGDIAADGLILEIWVERWKARRRLAWQGGHARAP